MASMGSSTALSLLELPTELILEVSSYLDGNTLSRLSRTCRTLRNICERLLYKDIYLPCAAHAGQLARTLNDRPDLVLLIESLFASRQYDTELQSRIPLLSEFTLIQLQCEKHCYAIWEIITRAALGRDEPAKLKNVVFNFDGNDCFTLFECHFRAEMFIHPTIESLSISQGQLDYPLQLHVPSTGESRHQRKTYDSLPPREGSLIKLVFKDSAISALGLQKVLMLNKTLQELHLSTRASARIFTERIAPKDRNWWIKMIKEHLPKIAKLWIRSGHDPARHSLRLGGLQQLWFLAVEPHELFGQFEEWEVLAKVLVSIESGDLLPPNLRTLVILNPWLDNEVAINTFEFLFSYILQGKGSICPHLEMVGFFLDYHQTLPSAFRELSAKNGVDLTIRFRARWTGKYNIS